MMGNSYTSANSLDSIVDGVMSAASNSANVTSLTGGGMRLSQHSNNVGTAGHQWNTTLNNGVWDWVVLQDQSQIPGFPRAHQEWISSKNGAVQLAQTIDAKGADSVLMMTWGRRDGDSVNTQRFPDFSTMQDELEAGYLDYRDNMSSHGDVWVAPVGLAFEYIHDQIIANGGTPTNSGNTFYDLYSSDGSHPSISGSYLAGLVIYATITGDDPVGLSHSTSLSNSVVLELQQAAAATVFNETAHLAYPWQTLSNGSGQQAYSPVPSPQNQSRYVQTFSLQVNDGDADIPGQMMYEYDDGKIVSVFKESFLSSGIIEYPSVSLWSYPPQGASSNSILDLADLSEDLEIPLTANFSNFKSCKPHVYSSEIYVYCIKYDEGGTSSDLLEFGNNNSILIESNQDVFMHWNISGHFVNAWIPQAGASSNQWSSELERLVSIDYFHKVHFVNDSIFMQLEWTSTHSITFPNGTLDCPSIVTGNCKILVKVNANGTLMDHLSITSYSASSNPNYGLCSQFDRFEIANKTSIQIRFNAGSDCDMYDSNGNQISFSMQNGGGIFFGFDLDLNLIRTVDEIICQQLYIKSVQILPEKTYYVAVNGHSSCSSEIAIWHNENYSTFDSTAATKTATLGSQYPNGTQEWTYSWWDNTDNQDSYSILTTSYGLIWTGPPTYSDLDWSQEANGRTSPYLGPSTNSQSWSTVMLDDGTWVDSFQGRYCASSGQYQERPIMFTEYSSGFSCSYPYGNDWRIESHSIDVDNDGTGHTLDIFPFESSQQTDADLDGFGDNIFGNDPDACPTEIGNSTLDRFGCLDTDGDGQSNLNDFYPTDPTQVSDTDFDGYGDNLTGTRGDYCPNEFGESNRNNTYGCSDVDYDGWADSQDHFPNQSSQWADSDMDGYGDEFNGYQGDACPQEYGLSTKDTHGCPDDDLDGWSNDGDGLPDEITQWLDGDGDGYGNNQSQGAQMIDLFPNDATQWNDTDGDGYGDNRFGSEGDKFPNDPTRWKDTDNDGFADGEDLFPTDITQWNDTDGDGYGNEEYGNGGDSCPTIFGNSTIDRRGCLDSDGDGWSDAGDDFPNDPAIHLDTDGDTIPDHLDEFPFDPTQWNDTDGDGYGDNPNGNQGDLYPDDENRHFDSDRDGIADAYDDFPFDPTQWVDDDGDGMGDNPMGIGADHFTDDVSQWGDIDGDGYGDNQTGTNPDAFPTDATQWSDADGDGYGDNPSGRLYDQFSENPTQWVDEDGDGLGDNQNGTYADPYLNDFDNDGYNDSIDILPRLSSPGDLDNDGCMDEVDAFWTNPLECLDTDGDLIGNNADGDDDGDGWTDADELRLGTDPLNPNDKPVDSFEIVIPGTNVGLGAWDLIGMFGGLPLFAWIGFGFATRNSRCDRYEHQLKAATTRKELEEIAIRSEYSLMLRMLGPHQGIKLERLRAELDDELENEALLSDKGAKILPEINTKNIPATSLTAERVDANGYHWLIHEGVQWYRTENESPWFRFEN